MSRHTTEVVSERKQITFSDLLGWVHFDKPWPTEQTQSSDTEDSVEDINHVAWPV
jgi:hypothetical protein